MRRRTPSNVSASVQRRLLNIARESGEDYQLILTRYALERFLRRLGASQFRDRFSLKGAMLYPIWGGALYRPTRDLDLHGNGEAGLAHLEEVFREICSLDVQDDGLLFLHDTVRGEAIREDQEYEGVRILLECRLASARIFLQIDIGFGDAVVPDPTATEYPTLLDFPAPRIRAYPRESVVAEKYQALVALGIANSRMKDYYDIWMIAHTFSFDGSLLSRALEATFSRRHTSIPGENPMGLSDEYCDDSTKNFQWRAFLRRTRLADETLSLRTAVEFLRGFLIPPSIALSRREEFALHWPPRGPWGRTG